MTIYLSSRKLKLFEIFSVKQAKNKTWPGEKSLSTNTCCDVIAGTEVIFPQFVYYNFVLRVEASYVVYCSFSRPDAENNITPHLRHLAVKGRLHRTLS